MKNIIFHHPLPLNENATSASGIRPLKMIRAFEKHGYQVTLVTGYGKERKKNIKVVKQKIKAGIKFDFLYSESSTQPTLLTEKNHLPIYPFLDFEFFKFCKDKGIKIGLFYRDIYWLFPEYGVSLSLFKRNIAKFFYYYDLKKYNDLVDIVYLPSYEMAKYIPTVTQNKFKPLPPGHDANKTKELKAIDEPIELLYIGGLGSHYQMHKLFSVLKKFPKIHFTLCTRENEWQRVQEEYNIATDNISIVHKNGDDLKELYQKAHIAMLFVKPLEYREFAAPVKLYEYIGEEKPIIASMGTLAGDLIKENDIGWSLEYSEEVLEEFFNNLLERRSVIFEKIKNIKKIKYKDSWEERAKEVQKDLSS